MKMPEGMKPGRPPIPPEKYQEFIDLIKAGNYIEVAAAVVGVSKKSVFNKLKEGQNPENVDAAEFLHSVKKAMAQAESRDVVIIGKAAEKNWTAAAWRLERKYERWRRRDRMDVQHGGSVGVSVHSTTPEELEFFKANFGALFPDLVGKVEDETGELPGDAETSSLEDLIESDLEE